MSRDILEKARILGNNYSRDVTAKTVTGERYILCDNAPSDWGKSTVLAKVANYYLNNPTMFNVLDSKLFKLDRWAVVEEKATGKIILIQTKGDIPGCYTRTLTYMSKQNNHIVDIIVCACRPNDATQQLVEKLAGKSFRLYYFRNYSAYKKKWTQHASDVMKDLLKNNIIDIINRL